MLTKSRSTSPALPSDASNVVPMSIPKPQRLPALAVALAVGGFLVTSAPTASAGGDTVKAAFDLLCLDPSVVSAIVFQKVPKTPESETAIEMVRDSGGCRLEPLEKSYAPVGQTGHNTLESTGIIRVSGNQPDFTKSLAQTQFVQANCNTMGCTNNTFPVVFRRPGRPDVIHCFPCDLK